MINQDLIDYIQKAKIARRNDKEITESLLQLGWAPEDIAESLRAATPSRYPWFQEHGKLIGGILLVIILLIIAGVLAYFVYLQPQTAIQAETQDCKDDMQCFVEASKSCTPAQVVWSNTIDIFGVQQETVTQLKVDAAQGAACNLYIKTERVTMNLPADTPPEVVAQSNEASSKLEGRDGTCTFKTTELTEVLTRWSQGTFASGEVSCDLSMGGNDCSTKGGDFANATCSGSYFEQPQNIKQ